MNSSAGHTVAPLQGALKDGFGQAVVASNMPEPCKFPSLDSRQKRSLWTHREVDLTLFQVGDTEQFHRALGFESLDPFFRVSKQGSCFTVVKEDGSDLHPPHLQGKQITK